MKAIQEKLDKLDQGVDAETELGRLGKTGNKHIFNQKGKGAGVWNGKGKGRFLRLSPRVGVVNQHKI